MGFLDPSGMGLKEWLIGVNSFIVECHFFHSFIEGGCVVWNLAWLIVECQLFHEFVDGSRVVWDRAWHGVELMREGYRRIVKEETF